MKTKTFLLVICLFSALSVFAGANKKADKQTIEWRYEIEPEGQGAQGSYKVKVWSFSKKQNVAQEQCKKNAVHGIVFKGYAGVPGKVAPQKPLVIDPAAVDQHADFFEKFFADGGDYMKFVQVVSGVPTVFQVGKEYKVGLIVIVQKDALRKYLEAAGVIKSLSAGF